MRKHIKRSRGYGLTAKGEVWKIAGPHSYMAGYCSHPDRFEEAIDAAIEEMDCLMAEANEEFGF